MYIIEITFICGGLLTYVLMFIYYCFVHTYINNYYQQKANSIKYCIYKEQKERKTIENDLINLFNKQHI